MKFWPILVDFTMTSHLLFSNNMTMVVNFEKNLILPGFLLNFRDCHRISKRVSSKALRVMEKKLTGVPKAPPGPNRVRKISKVFITVSCVLFSLILNDMMKLNFIQVWSMKRISSRKYSVMLHLQSWRPLKRRHNGLTMSSCRLPGRL